MNDIKKNVFSFHGQSDFSESLENGEIIPEGLSEKSWCLSINIWGRFWVVGRIKVKGKNISFGRNTLRTGIETENRQSIFRKIVPL